MGSQLLTVHQVAEQLGITEGTVRRWCRSGHLPAVWLAQRTIRVRQADLDEFIEAGRPEAGGDADADGAEA